MANGKKRPRFVSLKCPYSDCKNKIQIYPVFYEHFKETYEAWAIFSFEKGKAISELCKILYDGDELTPNQAKWKITGHNGTAWGKWDFDRGEDVVSLQELAVGIYGLRGLKLNKEEKSYFSRQIYRG